MKILLHAKADANQIRPANGVTALFTASCRNCVASAYTLVAAKATVNQCRFIGDGPLFAACQRGFTDLVEMFIAAKADVDLRNNNGNSPIRLACGNGYPDVVKIMLDAGANYNNIDGAGGRAIDYARLRRRWSVVAVLSEWIKKKESQNRQ